MAAEANVYAAGLFDWIEELIRRLRELLRELWDRLLSKIDSLLDRLRDAAHVIIEKLQALINTIAEKIETFIARLVSKLDDIIARIVDAINYLVVSIRTAISQAFSNLIGKIQELFSAIAVYLGDILTRIKDTIAGVISAITRKLSEIASWLGERIGDLAERIRAAIEAFANKIRDVYEAAAEKIRTLIATTLDKIRELISKLIAFIEQKYEQILEFLRENVYNKIIRAGEETKELVLFKANVLTKAALGQYNTLDEFINDLADPAPALGAIAAIIGGLILSLVIAPAVSSALAPALENITQLARTKFTPTLLSTSDILEAYQRQIVDDNVLSTELTLHGYKPHRISILKRLLRREFTVEETREAWLRGLISEQEHDERLRRLGYTPEDIAIIKKMYFALPTISDLIRMAVREVFSPEIAQKFGLFEDYPPQLTEIGRKLGLSEEVAKWYWAAHWDLPSATQGFEMFHRGIISYDELKMLLRALDVMPFWRDKLIQLSYNLPTRVDVRRMYKIGLITREEVYEFYKKLGYTDRDAEALTEFTVRYELPETYDELAKMRDSTKDKVLSEYAKGRITRENAYAILKKLDYADDDIEKFLAMADIDKEFRQSLIREEDFRELTRSQIENAYAKKMISRARALELLKEIGYDDIDANFVLDYIDYVNTMRLREKLIDAVHDAYVKRNITIDDVLVRLNEIGVSAEEAKQYLEEWDIEREIRTRKPTEAMLIRWYRKGLITLEEFIEEMKALGWADKYIEIMLKELGGGGYATA
ncbi:MAG: hypothetical protein QXR40_06180 [Candidatus Bathyarchaeia archaeon]